MLKYSPADEFPAVRRPSTSATPHPHPNPIAASQNKEREAHARSGPPARIRARIRADAVATRPSQRSSPRLGRSCVCVRRARGTSRRRVISTAVDVHPIRRRAVLLIVPAGLRGGIFCGWRGLGGGRAVVALAPHTGDRGSPRQRWYSESPVAREG